MPRELTKDYCLSIAKNCFNRNELQKKDCYVYKVMYKQGWLGEAFPSRFMRKCSWTRKDLEKIAKKYKTKNQFKWCDYNAYHAARRRDFFEDICSHMETKYGSDENVFYLLKLECSEDLYKAGITSLKCGKRRLNELKSDSGLKFKEVFWIETENAARLENSILSMGEPVETVHFRGHTEVRKFNPVELSTIKRLLDEEV